MAINRLSNNVGGVKHFSSVLIRARGRARHFALVEDVPIQPKPARNQFSGLELSPTHASPLLRLFPGILTTGARFSGKATSANRLLAARSLTS